MIEQFRNFHFQSCNAIFVISLYKKYSNTSYILTKKKHHLLYVKIGCSLFIPMGIAKYMLLHNQSPNFMHSLFSVNPQCNLLQFHQVIISTCNIIITNILAPNELRIDSCENPAITK